MFFIMLFKVIFNLLSSTCVKHWSIFRLLKKKLSFMYTLPCFHLMGIDDLGFCGQLDW
jgi:hypothetical protein